MIINNSIYSFCICQIYNQFFNFFIKTLVKNIVYPIKRLKIFQNKWKFGLAFNLLKKKFKIGINLKKNHKKMNEKYFNTT